MVNNDDLRWIPCEKTPQEIKGYWPVMGYEYPLYYDYNSGKMYYIDTDEVLILCPKNDLSSPARLPLTEIGRSND